MLIDDAIHEATHLLGDLRSLRADDAVAEAELLVIALGHEAVRHVMGFVWETLERIGTTLPPDTQAEVARTRLQTVAGMIEALDVDEVRYGT